MTDRDGDRAEFHRVDIQLSELPPSAGDDAADRAWLDAAVQEIRDQAPCDWFGDERDHGVTILTQDDKRDLGPLISPIVTALVEAGATPPHRFCTIVEVFRVQRFYGVGVGLKFFIPDGGAR